jgi:hypothetical protein
MSLSTSTSPLLWAVKRVDCINMVNDQISSVKRSLQGIASESIRIKYNIILNMICKECNFKMSTDSGH